MLNLVLFGPPGAGKGTQAALLVESLGLIHLSTGELLRDEIKKGTQLGILAENYIEKGELVPDGVVIDMIKTTLDNHKDAKGFVFDGFPRTVAQAEVLDCILEKSGVPIAGMISLDVEKEELISRLLSRGKFSGRVDDQGQSVIENRIAIYGKKTLPLIKYYEPQGKYYKVKGTGTVAEVAERLKAVVENLQAKA